MDRTALAGQRILLLEDDSDSRETMSLLLELAGASVVSTPTTRPPRPLPGTPVVI
jgi:hypothetical protein